MEKKAQGGAIQHNENNHGLAIASLVLGIVSIVLVIVPILPYFLSILAIIFGALGGKNASGSGLAKAGIILGIISIGLKLLFWLVIGGLIGSLA